MELGQGDTKCYWLEPTDEVRIQLRRFSWGVSMSKEGVWEERRRGRRPCSGVKPHSYKEGGAYWSGCNASVLLDRKRKKKIKVDPEDGYKTLALVPKSWVPPRSDPAWPTVCENCGFPLEEEDQWQTNQVEIYRRADTGEEVIERGRGGKHMAGALYHSWWRESYVVKTADGGERGYCGPDGICLTAVCPNGTVWEVDGPATGGGGWTRTGDPRKPETLTVQPSIVAGDYHGFLQQGRFTGHVG